MTVRDIERSFLALASRISAPLDVLLLGGGAAIVQTGPRITRDLDIELQPRASAASPAEMAHVYAAIRDTEARTGVPMEVAEHAMHWSMINWADYRDHQRLWKRFGPISVHLLEPEYFVLTKLTRSSEVDLRDIRKVVKRHGGAWEKIARISGRALRESPRSTAQDLFRRHVEHFFRNEGPRLWGKPFELTKAIELFRRSYGPGTAAGS